MRSFGKYCTALFVTLASLPVCAQELSPAAAPAPRTVQGARYAALLEPEQEVSQSTASTADDFRAVVDRYWSFVQRYPVSGYTDNALWQAAHLSAEAFRRFSQDRDKYRAVQLFQWLRDQYPHSSFQAKVFPLIEELEAIPAVTAPPAASAGPETFIRAIHRSVLEEVVRVTVELDREVPFYQERLEGPARVFFDLKGTKTVPSLVDATFRYDSDIIRHIRLGRHPNSTTRVVLDLENVSRFSVFTLYNPYRIVIDAERSPGVLPKPRAPRTLNARSVAPFAPTAPIAPIAPIAPLAPIPPARTLATPASVPVTPIPRIAIVLPPAHAPRTASARALPTVPDPPVPPPAAGGPAKPTAPDTASAPSAPGVIAGRPLSPSANSSGKFSVARQLGLGVSRIVIDAGHGGHDPGASTSDVTEAELVLDVTLRLEELLKQQPGVEVVLTRRTNEYLSLEERTDIANRESADLFLSIHANASANAAARGVETYFLNFALNPQAEAVAARENAASGKTMSSLPGILKAITLNNKLNESRDFAASIQRSLVRGMRPANRMLRDLGVKQAPFMVLIGAAMPSVLAEISFVTNAQEARLLKTSAYRQRIADSLLAGILRYQQSLKKVQTAALQ
jgi:N-acetylmuramoyl-L-alanine amidase